MEEQNWKRRGLAAEKTVEVLKNKVRSMYQGGSKTSVQRQLEKAKERDGKNRQRREMMEMKAAQLEQYSQTLEGEVAARTREIQVILDNVTFGFLLIDSEMKVLSGFTESCATLLGREVKEGQCITDLLGCDEKQGAILGMGVDQIFDDFMPEELTLAQLASRFTPGESILNLEARCVRGADGAVSALLCTLSDIRALEAAKQASNTAEILTGILAQKDAFINFIQETKAHIESAKSAVAEGRSTFVARAAHTVKGNAASYGLNDVASAVHEIEEKDSISHEDLCEIEDTIVEFLNEHQKVLDVNYHEAVEEQFALSQKQVRELELLLEQVENPAIAAWMTQLRQKSAGVIVGPVHAYIRKLSERLEKTVDFTFDGDDVYVDSQQMGSVLSNLTHVLRNAVDHGLEQPAERGEKPDTCSLALCVTAADVGWTISVSDDGRGIDVWTLGNKAIQSGVITQQDFDEMSHEERLRLVFRDKLSSNEVANDLSGRGVGMSAVLGAVEEHGGHVQISSTPGKGTTFTIFVPRDTAAQVAA